MCGIAGIASWIDDSTPGLEKVRAMCSTIVHRGPDDEGLHLKDRVALGMRRLSIIDVEGGSQPIFNEDKSVRLVYNGEIYNFRDLRIELESRGHRFTSRTDGEVIVHLWEEHGLDFVNHLNGMFAIALHDSNRRELVLARDRLGIKPLFYSLTSGHLIFASEIKALLASQMIDRELDLEAVGELISWEYIPAPSTLLRSVKKLDSAEMLTVDLAGGHTRKFYYWDVPLPEDAVREAGQPRRAEEWAETIDEKIRTCVKRQLVSDVPLGAFLSGGVDSSLIVAGMGEAQTFSIGFNDPSYNELRWSEKVARHLGVNHETEVIEPEVAELFEQLMVYMDDPIGDFSIFPTFLVSRLAREHVTVALSGDGGDELFGGYESFVAQQMARTWGRIPAPLRKWIMEPLIDGFPPRASKKGLVNKAKRFVEGLSHDASLLHSRWRLFAGESLRKELFSDESQNEMRRPASDHIHKLLKRAGNRSEVDRCLYVDLKSYLPDNCLVKVDRMSMACSLETRVPFLDHELVELAFQLPSELKVSGGKTKVLLKEVAARHVPRDCIYRPKEGFSIPIKHWLGNEFKPLMDELLDSSRLQEQGLFRAGTVDRLKDEHLQGRANHSHILWTLMVFQDWRERWAV